MIEFKPAIPILRIFDVTKAKEFYLNYLGFQTDWEHRYADDLPLYMQVHLGNLVLHLSEHHGDGSPGVAIYMPMTGIEEFQATLSARNYRYARPGLPQEANTKNFSLRDPFGNELRFEERG